MKGVLRNEVRAWLHLDLVIKPFYKNERMLFSDISAYE